MPHALRKKFPDKKALYAFLVRQGFQQDLVGAWHRKRLRAIITLDLERGVYILEYKKS